MVTKAICPLCRGCAQRICERDLLSRVRLPYMEGEHITWVDVGHFALPAVYL